MKRSLTYRRFFPDALSLNVGFSQTLLQRGALLAGVLAVIAGILGMHVLTANHAAHGTHTAAVQSAGALVAEVNASGAHAGAAHAEHSHAEPAQAGQEHAVPAGVVSCGGSCHGMQESGTSCIPSAQAGTLAFFPPHQTGAAVHPQHARSGPAMAYAYTPRSPTPCDLSISRT